MRTTTAEAERHGWAAARQHLTDFFFAQETPFALAIIRIVLPLVVMTMVYPRWPHARELYSSDGAPAPLAMGYGYPHFLPELSGHMIVGLISLLSVALVTASIGWHTRLSLAICFISYTYLSLMDACSTMTKYSVITSHVLLLLMLSPCGAIWSVDAWLQRRNSGPTLLPVTFPAWPRRCIQLLIGLIYFGAALTKMNTPTFFSGDQLMYWMLTHINFRHPIGEMMALYPVMLKVMGYVAIVWEVTFVFLVWRGIWRPWVLGLGVLFHSMTTITLGLLIFPMVCYCTYLAFIEEPDLTRFRRWLMPWWQAGSQRWHAMLSRTTPSTTGSVISASGDVKPSAVIAISRVGSPPPPSSRWRLSTSTVAFAGVCLIAVFGGVELEHWLDPYGLRRAEGRYALQPLDEQQVQRMLQFSPGIRNEDKFFSVDVGTFLIGDHLADRRRQFQPGDKLVVQCLLTPPHEDLWVECVLEDARRRTVDRMSQVALRETYRSNFHYWIPPQLPPGEYAVVIKTSGMEVLRKRIEVVGDQPPVSVAVHDGSPAMP
jgi:hypothetical protein